MGGKKGGAGGEGPPSIASFVFPFGRRGPPFFGGRHAFDRPFPWGRHSPSPVDVVIKRRFQRKADRDGSFARLGTEMLDYL